jgi:hypothetical protein
VTFLIGFTFGTMFGIWLSWKLAQKAVQQVRKLQ